MSLVLTATARSRVPGRCFRPLELVIQHGLPLESSVCVHVGVGGGGWGGGGGGGGGGGSEGREKRGASGNGVRESGV